jgi:hypothetical protein
MEKEDLLKKFEINLENLIKRCFEKELYDEDNEFDIAADYDTDCRLNSLVNKIGLEVYGMRITPSEFVITFEFIDAYEELIYKLNGPKYCHISLKNDGNYEFCLTKSDLAPNFWLSITDHQFNRKTTDETKFNEISKAMNDTLLIYILKT